MGERLRKRGDEFGSVTGRPRRTGWLDLPALRYAVRVNGLDGLALTKLDVLTGLDEIQVCVAYDTPRGRRPTTSRSTTSRTRARLRADAGWTEDLGAARTLADLPAAARGATSSASSGTPGVRSCSSASARAATRRSPSRTRSARSPGDRRRENRDSAGSDRARPRSDPARPRNGRELPGRAHPRGAARSPSPPGRAPTPPALGSYSYAMLFPLAAALVLAQAASWSTGRPPECADPGGRAANVWERARSPELRRYCDLVASASSKLAGTTAMAEAALASAREADAVLPGHAAPRVLEGRALAALGKLDEALQGARGGAQSRDAGGARRPAGAARLGARPRADRAPGRRGRRVPRAPAARLGDLRRRSGRRPRSRRVSSRWRAAPAGLDEAVGRAARGGARGAGRDARGARSLALALALDRRGDADEARALLAERAHGDPRIALGVGAAPRRCSPWRRPRRTPSSRLALEPTDAGGRA